MLFAAGAPQSAALAKPSRSFAKPSLSSRVLRVRRVPRVFRVRRVLAPRSASASSAAPLHLSLLDQLRAGSRSRCPCRNSRQTDSVPCGGRQSTPAAPAMPATARPGLLAGLAFAAGTTSTTVRPLTPPPQAAPLRVRLKTTRHPLHGSSPRLAAKAFDPPALSGDRHVCRRSTRSGAARLLLLFFFCRVDAPSTAGRSLLNSVDSFFSRVSSLDSLALSLTHRARAATALPARQPGWQRRVFPLAHAPMPPPPPARLVSRAGSSDACRQLRVC